MIVVKLLEKGRPAAMLGARKIQNQKRIIKDKKTGKTKVVMTRVWMRKEHDGWKYDGMVSPGEYKASQTIKRKTTAGQKKIEETRLKVENAEEDKKKREAEATSDKPDAATLANAPTKTKLYWDDKTTDEQRLLCDQTGILTRDKNAHDYLKRKMGSVFAMTSTQKNVVDDINPFLALGSDGKAFDDPLFLADTLVNMKAMKKALLSFNGKEARKEEAREDWVKMAGYDKQNYMDSFQEYTESMDAAIESQFDERIEALEKASNDKILLSKLKAWDKGVRGVKNIDNMHHILLEGIFGSLTGVKKRGQYGVGDYVEWDDMPKSYQTMLDAYGLNSGDWNARGWGLDEMTSFALASVNDEYRDLVHQPWLESMGNVGNERTTYTNPYGGGDRVITLATNVPPMRTDAVSIAVASEKVRKNINKLTVDFMQENFRFSRIEPMNLDDIRANYADALTSADNLRATIAGGNVTNAYLPDRAVNNSISHFTAAYMRAFDSVTPDDRAEMGIKKDVSWRDFANGVKAMQRRKGFDQSDSINQVSLDAIVDMGKALGTTQIKNTADGMATGYKNLYKDLSASQKLWIRTPDSNKIRSNFVHVFGAGDRYADRNVMENFTSRSAVTVVDPTVKKTSHRGNSNGLIEYANFRKSPKGRWTAGNYYKETYALGSTTGEKGAIKAKFLSLFGTVNSQYDRSARTFSGSHASHVDTSIKLMTGMNWQLKELLKDQADVVPKWRWSPTMVPFGTKNGFSRIDSIKAGVSYNKKDTLGRSILVNRQLVSEQMNEHYKSSVASVMGLSATDLTTNKRTMPKIVLKTNAGGKDEWQKKIDDSWTHDDPRIAGSHGWRKGSLQVNDVFDIEYHDYYGKYKEIEKEKGNVKYLWHGTSQMAGAHVIKGGFDRGRGLYGQGQYGAESASKAAQYLMGGAGHFSRRPGITGVMFWNRCAMGKTNDPGQSPDNAVHDPTIDTVYAPGITGRHTAAKWGGMRTLGHDEWCVKNRKGVIPIQWVDVVTV